MEGPDHGLLAVAGWLGAAPLLPRLLARPDVARLFHHASLPALTPGRLAAGTVLVAGAGLIPDWDFYRPPGHDKYGQPTPASYASAAYTFPWVGEPIARGVHSACGGHRHGTHSLVAIYGALCGGWWLSDRFWWRLALTFMLAALTLHIVPWKQLRRLPMSWPLWCRRCPPRPAQLAAAAGIACGLTLGVPLGHWLGVVAAVGVASHCVADQFNPEGWQPFWPVLSWRLRTPLFRTAGRAEQWASKLFVAGDLALVGLLCAGCMSTTPAQTPPPASGVPVSACHATGRTPADVLPDPRCTPGAVNPAVTQQNLASTICRAGWTAAVRPPVSYTNALKVHQMAAYGLSGVVSTYEEDHRVPLEVGGAPSDPRNLWPELGHVPNPKDRIEGAVRRQVCNGRLTLAQGQAVFLGDWWTWRMP